MCPLFYLLMLSLFLLPILLLTSAAASNLKWNATFAPSPLEMKMDKVDIVNLTLYGLTDDFFDTKYINDRNYLTVKSMDPDLAAVSEKELAEFMEVSKDQGKWSTQFKVSGKFLGKTEIVVELRNSKTNQTESSNPLDVIVTRTTRLIDTLFTISVISFIGILYICFGATIDLSSISGILKKPIGPSICFVSQFIFMPLASFALGYFLFPSKPELAIGLFFTGVSPGGGASNMWALLLGGNINLSITMTTLSTLLAFGTMPLWIFSLGQFVFDRANLGIPYRKIATFAIGLIIPLLIGVGIQKYFERCAKFLMRILKPLTFGLLIFIIVFAIISNLYLFKLFSLQIVLAGLGLPWLGFLFGWVSSKIFNQKTPDALAIAIETGIQNTGISIYLLTFSLDQPAADLTTVVPVAVAIMTPFPLMFLWFVQKFRSCYQKNQQDKLILNGSDSVQNYSSVSIS